VGLSLVLGVLIHVLFTQFLKLAASNPYRITLRNGIYIFQLFALLSLAYVLPEQHKWVLWLQSIGFHALGLFLVSIYSNRAKHHA
jgi:Na+/proline symporter